VGPGLFEASSFPLGGRLGRGYLGIKRTPVVNIEVPTFEGKGNFVVKKLCINHITDLSVRRKMK
jgi:hypothetical protein